MGRRQTVDGKSVKDALRLCANAGTVEEMRMALAVVLPGMTGASLSESAEIIGVSQSTVSRLRKKFLTGKRPDLNWKSGWGGRRRCNLSKLEEDSFVKKWSTAAGKDGIATLHEVWRDYLQVSGTDSPKSTVHRLFRRNGWGKVKLKNGARVWKICEK